MAGYPFNPRGWGAVRIAQPRKRLFWAPYEQYGYWVDGMTRCGHLLGDPFLIGKAKKQIDYVLQHADADGYLGPGIIKPRGNRHRWPHAIVFRALIAHCSATNDKSILAALRRHYLAERTPHFEHRDVCQTPLPGDPTQTRLESNFLSVSAARRDAISTRTGRTFLFRYAPNVFPSGARSCSTCSSAAIAALRIFLFFRRCLFRAIPWEMRFFPRFPKWQMVDLTRLAWAASLDTSR